MARVAHVPVPGPVIGMVLLLGVLEWRSRALLRAPSAALKSTAQGLLSNLSLLFVPAGVGVVTQLSVVRANLTPIAAAIIVSTAAGLAVTGWVMQRLLRPEPASET